MIRGQLFWKIFLSYIGLMLLAMTLRHWWGLALAGIVGVYVAYRITRPLRELTLTAEALRQGNYERRIHQLPPNEFGILGDALNQLGATLALKISSLAQEQSQLSAIMAGMVEGVVAVDVAGRVIFCNRSASALLGTSEAEMLGKYLWEVTRVAELVELFERARQASSVPLLQEITIAHTPRVVTIQAHGSRFEGDGEHTRGVVMVLNDLTHLKQLERVRQDFVANVSHELKTPLTAIRGFVETLLHRPEDDLTHRMRFLQKIDTQVARLMRLIDELLTLARIETAEERLPLEPVDWGAIVHDVVARYEAAVAEKAITTRVEVPSSPVLVMGNAEALSVITSNVLDNAVKYTAAGGNVSVALLPAAAHVRLAIRDTGVGIPRHEQERIFERFYRVDKARTGSRSGCGLGLAIVKHLVQTVHGELAVESAEGRGSTFIVTVPSANFSISS